MGAIIDNDNVGWTVASGGRGEYESASDCRSPRLEVAWLPVSMSRVWHVYWESVTMGVEVLSRAIVTMGRG